MNRHTIPFLLVLLAPCGAYADINRASTTAANDVCRRAIVAAERGHGIPSHLLAAIARVESGRRDQASGTFSPWPWTINMDGQGSFYETKAEAVAAATAMRARTTKSIDVGCMQISLTYHPNAFPDMERAFDPASNTDYGARFLTQLFEKTNSWPRAVEMYHSATPDIGAEYGQRVYAVLPEEQRLAGLLQPEPAISPLGNPWGPTMGRSTLFPPLRQGAAHVIPQMPGLAGGTPSGRSLDSYRSAPVHLAFRVS